MPATRSSRRAAALALCTAAALAAAAPAALADSIVFIKNANVWLANPDGSGQFQVTTDGTAANPWQSPSQADDGTIVAVRAQPNWGPIVRMKQNGEVINEIPVAPMQVGPFEPAISPDGTKVAYEHVFTNSFETSNDVRVTDVTGLTAPTVYGHPGSGAGSPSWLGNDRIFVGDYTSAGTMVLGQPVVEWWNDSDHADRFRTSEDLDDGEVASDGTIAFVRGDRDDNTIQLYGSGGLATRPSPTCTLSNPTHGPLGARFSDPTLAPGGGAMAWQEGDGIWTIALPPGRCAEGVPRLTIPGASEPDWGPAAVNPGPRPQPKSSSREPTRPEPTCRERTCREEISPEEDGAEKSDRLRGAAGRRQARRLRAQNGARALPGRPQAQARGLRQERQAQRRGEGLLAQAGEGAQALRGGREAALPLRAPLSS